MYQTVGERERFEFKPQLEGPGTSDLSKFFSSMKLVHLDQWFSNLSLNQNHLDGLLKWICWVPPCDRYSRSELEPKDLHF